MKTVSGAMSAGLVEACFTGAGFAGAEGAFIRTGMTLEANGEEDAVAGSATEAAGTGVEAAAGSLLLLNVTSKRLPLAETW